MRALVLFLLLWTLTGHAAQSDKKALPHIAGQAEPKTVISPPEARQPVDSKATAEKTNLNRADLDGWTPLMSAAQKHDLPEVRRLLKHGADINLRNNRHETALHIAIDVPPRKTDPYLLKTVNTLIDAGVSLNARNYEERTPLFLAVTRGYTGVVDALLNAGADPDRADNVGWTPLMNAIYQGDLHLVKRLLDAGADVTLTNSLDWTALHLTAHGDSKGDEEAHVQIAHMLIEAGADPNARDRWENTPLYTASRYQRLKIADLLINSGADVNRANFDGVTPLMIAAYNGDPAMVKRLLDAGADPDLTCRDLKRTALHYTTDEDNLQEEKHLAAAAQLLIDHGAKLNIRDVTQATPLYLAAKVGHPLIVKALIKAGADLNQVQMDGWSPLMRAAQYGDVVIVDMLLKAGAEVELKNRYGWTALYMTGTRYPAPATREELQTIARMLIRAGANTEILKEPPNTPLRIDFARYKY